MLQEFYCQISNQIKLKKQKRIIIPASPQVHAAAEGVRPDPERGPGGEGGHAPGGDPVPAPGGGPGAPATPASGHHPRVGCGGGRWLCCPLLTASLFYKFYTRSEYYGIRIGFFF